MNLWIRVLWLLATSWRRGVLDPASGVSVVRLRVWFTDLDLSAHMNNGRYLTLMDLGRTDLIIRSSLWKLVVQRRLTPVVGTAAIRFRRELRLFQAFDLETRIVGWQGDMVVIEQRFRIASGARAGQYAATALVRAGLYDRKLRAMVPVDELMRATGRTAIDSPALPEGATALLQLDGVMQRETPRTAIT